MSYYSRFVEYSFSVGIVVLLSGRQLMIGCHYCFVVGLSQ